MSDFVRVKDGNLNEMTIAVDNCFGNRGIALQGNQATVNEAKVSCFFRDVEQALIQKILGARAVVGCVAWLTNYSILTALQKVSGGVSIVVQKEDFLRPDIGSSGQWKANLRNLYDRLPSLDDRCLLGGLVGRLSTGDDLGIDPIRCMGNHNSEKSPAFPRMHNKFLVFCVDDKCTFEVAEGSFERTFLRPVSVWTGSFNFTANSSRSLENAVLIENAEIASRYYHEWEQILALSEHLDWKTEWCAPEWRIGS